MKSFKSIRTGLLLGSGLAAMVLEPVQAAAQTASGDSGGGLEEIVVTAQKREQSVQDVPIAVTAISESQLASNRIVNVQDLSGLAPNTIVRPAAGGTGIASFSMRGVVSFGVVPGSDKQVSIYLDGVYISSTRASIFDVPDIERIEVLRGPQGTLFGRNATAGAVSIVTRGPSGEFGVTQSATYGNLGQLRLRTTVDLPAVGPFSAYVSYVHNERRGDIRNLGAGTVWDRTGPDGLGVAKSPKYLGSHNSESIFAAVKFEPSDSFKTTYKFDWTGDHFTPEGNAPVGVNSGNTNGAVIAALVANSPNAQIFVPDSKRPKATNNWWVVPGYQRNSGHSLTSELRLSDSLSLKNIAAYRSSYLYGVSEIGGLGGLVVNAAVVAAVPSLASSLGNRYIAQATQRIARSQQWSDELQLNYDSRLLTLTAGAIWFHSKDREGGPTAMRGTWSRLSTIPNSTGLIPLGTEAISYNKATSVAGYAQAEVHVLPVLDVVGGIRITQDKKSGTYVSGGTWVPATAGSRTDGTMTGQTVLSFKYKKSTPSYSLGVNYKPNSDFLVYAKYSKANVSGGAIGGVSFKPETAKAWEAGVKATMLDGHLRTNLSVFSVEYANQQTAQSGALVGFPALGTVVITLGEATSANPAVTKAKGFELEVTAVPTRGVTLGGSLGYTDVKISGDVNNTLLFANGLSTSTSSAPAGASAHYLTTSIPKWTSNLYAQYESEPLFGDARLNFRVDANWRSKYRSDANDDLPLPVFATTEFSPAQWIVNARLALSDIDLGGAKTTVALWSRNLFNDKTSQFRSGLPGTFLAFSFQQARTIGADVTVKF